MRQHAGRRGGKRNLLPLAKRMRREPTEAERRLWALLRAGRMAGFKFKRQEQIGDFIVDFICFQARLIVEADGSQHADSGSDVERDAWLASQGFRVLRFWNNDILSDTDAVAAAILQAVEAIA
ncbi:MAG: endonuclease domain-containing protein [Sphingomonadaceae bacterium]|nr:endonuclease domain-containing protein [Sphingomonadaceae bacterium]MCP5385047.1 endonuclease domain-containing protein [Altererythrobacter sp.]MCP5391975.1 endonuclease domain-containing protein [Sphingomonadaceae bacterium]MCP5394109.1 endonuclease domain-containing protein [Sphingomonadaceae bacterium]